MSEANSESNGVFSLVLRRVLAEGRVEVFRLTRDGTVTYFAVVNGVPFEDATFETVQLADHAATLAVAKKARPRSAKMRFFLPWIAASICVLICGGVCVNWKFSLVIPGLLVVAVIVYRFAYHRSTPRIKPVANLRIPRDVRLDRAGSPERQIGEYEQEEMVAMWQPFSSAIDLRSFEGFVDGFIKETDWFVNRHIMDDHLLLDIDANSLDLVELVMDAETLFNVSIPDEIASNVTTIGHLVRMAIECKSSEA